MTPDHSALIERLDLIVAELESLPHVKQTVSEAAAALRDLTEWRDISTAPKDGTVVVGFDEPEIVSLWWSDSLWASTNNPDRGRGGGWVQDVNRSDTIVYSPTHWLPLPSAPNQAKEAGE